ncbi:hypothetical protein PHMEG_0001684 [Phytophthora megakarya]|uniref:Extradiol ring-cleavage dioxygenase class III enzyme subunit B domain-containing protein n=1 Tax=Phytophthora megakarya TaxID=4795 RepID=A0A225X279_9STRA|nr:hypothetical protein PHMEG_0001684 [Phytophthora megakarya]
MPSFRHPVVAISHGPGPAWLFSSGPKDLIRDTRPAAQLMSSLLEKLYPNDENLPKRILFVSAHFESDSSGFEISNASNPDMIYDYYGFPDEAYNVQYPAEGDPAFAQRVKEQLKKNKIKVKLVNRGYDHGVFVPMTLIRPQADIPIVTLSINSDLSDQTHFHSTHNLRDFHSRSPALMEGNKAFQYWLDNTLSSDSNLSVEERTKQITNWRDAPGARYAHPSPNHFMPFVIAAGAGIEDKEAGARAFFRGWVFRHMALANLTTSCRSSLLLEQG